MREAYAGFEEVLDAQHPYTLTALGGLAAVLTGLERYDEAEALALDSHQRCVARYGVEHAETQAAVSLLRTIYERTGRSEQAEKLAK